MTTLDRPRPDFDADEAVSLARRDYGLNAVPRQLDSERDRNYLLTAGQGRYVLKIANPAEDPAVVEMQDRALAHVARTDPGLPVPRPVRSRSGASILEVQSDAGRCLARLVTYLEGGTLGESADPTLRAELGSTLARLGRALRGFFHPAARRELLWDLQQAASLRPLTAHIVEPVVRAHVDEIVGRFCNEVLPRLPALRAQVIHNDFNPDNVLVDPDRQRVCGIIDFGDLVHGPLICDLAIAASYQLEDSEQPFAGVITMLAAYHAVTPLEDEEIALLFDLVATRVATTVTVASWRAARHPANRKYILTSFARAVRLIARLRQVDRAAVVAQMRAACGLAAPHADADTASLVAHRERYLGPLYRLFYERPLHIVRGRGAWLYDSDGRAYLDAYNNVPCVGHCRPEVVAAIAAQQRRLNTHTRYLHTTVLDYARRLASRFPFEDALCMFCCTGSEANELAYRIAMAHTAATGVVVTAHAYHGNTSTVAQFSTADVPPQRRAAYVETVSAPDSYRGAHERGETGLARYFAAQVDGAIAVLAARDVRPAALLVDTIFSCDGIVSAPPGYLADAAARMRAAGGLLIADEVQAGFGRTGETWWGFERHGVVPDIVTLGKPMANGHPVAAVVTTPAIVEAFAAGVDYFNTFGGNPVSAAAGLAVLDVIEREKLRDNARQVGDYLQERLRRMQARHRLIGDVRGAGLYIGVELVEAPDTLEPATDAARRVVNGLREAGLLIGATGPFGNVLKIRPPLVFSISDADRLLAAVDAVLSSL